jgi:hypothetical protein
VLYAKNSQAVVDHVRAIPRERYRKALLSGFSHAEHGCSRASLYRLQALAALGYQGVEFFDQ